MEIHKPKPVRNWREFLKEYAIIVLGVATALAAEQAVEWWHWQDEVKAARTALAEEMITNNHDFFVRRIAIQACLDRQIKEADAILSALEAGREPGKFTVFRVGSGTLISWSEWQSQRASQVLTHFPHSEQALMGRYYALMDNFQTFLNTEGEVWQELTILQNPPSGMTTSDRMRLRADLGAAQRMNSLIVLNARRELRISKLLGLADVQADPARVRSFCTFSTEDYQRFNAAQQIR